MLLTVHEVVSSNSVSARCDRPELNIIDKAYQYLDEGSWFSPDTLASSTNKNDRHGIAK